MCQLAIKNHLSNNSTSFSPTTIYLYCQTYSLSHTYIMRYISTYDIYTYASIKETNIYTLSTVCMHNARTTLNHSQKVTHIRQDYLTGPGAILSPKSCPFFLGISMLILYDMDALVVNLGYLCRINVNTKGSRTGLNLTVKMIVFWLKCHWNFSRVQLPWHIWFK